MAKRGRPLGSKNRKGGGLASYDKTLRFGMLEPHEVVEKLKELQYMDEDGNLTERGKGWAEARLKKMDNGELILIEKYVLEHFDARSIEYV